MLRATEIFPVFSKTSCLKESNSDLWDGLSGSLHPAPVLLRKIKIKIYSYIAAAWTPPIMLKYPDRDIQHVKLAWHLNKVETATGCVAEAWCSFSMSSELLKCQEWERASHLQLNCLDRWPAFKNQIYGQLPAPCMIKWEIFHCVF